MVSGDQTSLGPAGAGIILLTPVGSKASRAAFDVTSVSGKAAREALASTSVVNLGVGAGPEDLKQHVMLCSGRPALALVYRARIAALRCKVVIWLPIFASHAERDAGVFRSFWAVPPGGIHSVIGSSLEDVLMEDCGAVIVHV